MTPLEAKLARYEQLIPHLASTQTALWRMVDEEMMRAACGVMASVAKCRFMPRDGDSITLMLNYCCFNVFFPGGQTLVEVYATQHSPANEDERAVLQAHQRSYFSLFEVMERVPRIGLQLRELFTDEIILVVNPRLAETMQPGWVLPVRAMPLEDFHVLFNAPFPFNKVPSVQAYEDSLFRAYGKYGVQKGRPLTAEQRGNIETFQTIDVLSLRYPELSPSRRREASSSSETKTPRFGQELLSAPKGVRRNDPCPCGSGKKFKHCCLGRN